MLTMAPPVLASRPRAAWQTRIVPVRLTATTRSKTARSYSSRRRIMPAQFTTASRRARPPKNFSTACGSVTSSAAARIDRPAAFRLAMSASLAVRPVTSTSAPSAANASATPHPMPLVPPVTSADLPENCTSFASPVSALGCGANGGWAPVRFDPLAGIFQDGSVPLQHPDLLLDHVLHQNGAAVGRERDSLRPAPYPRGGRRDELRTFDAIKQQLGLLAVERRILGLVAPVHEGDCTELAVG